MNLEVPMCFITGDSDDTCSWQSLASLRPHLASWDVRAAFVPVSHSCFCMPFAGRIQVGHNGHHEHMICS